MKGIFITIAIVFAATMFYGLGSIGLKGGFNGRETNMGLARVDGREVDKFRFNQIVNRIIGGQAGQIDPLSLFYIQSSALAQLIDFEIIAMEAEKHESASGDEINKAVEDIMKANKIPDKATFNKLLKAQGGFSVDDLKRTIKEEIVSQRMISKIRGGVTITPDDLREIRTQHILISTMGPKAKKQNDAKKTAEELLDKINKGADFAALAEEYSDDPGSAKNGGDLGFFKKSAMVKEFSDAAYALKPGQVSGIVKTAYGYHIIKMNESRVIGNANRDQLLKEKQDNAFQMWVISLKAKAKISIENHLFKAFDLQMKGNPVLADEEYKKAIKAQPSNVYSYIFHADFLSKSNSPEAAAAEYDKASEIAGPDPYAHLYIGKAYLAAAKFKEKAGEEFKKASILAGENRQIREELAKQFKALKLNDLLSQENAKIEKLKEKERFEEEIRKKSGAVTPETGAVN